MVQIGESCVAQRYRSPLFISSFVVDCLKVSSTNKGFCLLDFIQVFISSNLFGLGIRKTRSGHWTEER